MNELMTIIQTEVEHTRFGSIQLELTMHDGQIRYINVTRTTRHNLATKHNKEAKNGKK